MDKPYQTYSLEELIADPDFRNWVLHPCEETTVFWQDFLMENPDKRALILEAKNLVEGVYGYFDRGTTDSQKLDKGFQEVIRRVNSSSYPKSPTATIRRFPYRKLAGAASILFILGIAGWFLVNQQFSYESHITDYGEWQTVALPDGSTVQLNANSELKFAKNWEVGEDREVWLKGEAFFNVEKKPVSRAKFLVVTDEASVEVLGTSFNVSSRGKKTEVFLEEGEVKLNVGDNATYMEPGDLIAYSASKDQIVENRKGVNDIHSSWKDGVLILQQKSVEEIFYKIAEIYGIKFQIKNQKLLESTTTVRIPMDKLELALPILEKTLGTRIEQTGNQLLVQ